MAGLSKCDHINIDRKNVRKIKQKIEIEKSFSRLKAYDVVKLSKIPNNIHEIVAFYDFRTGANFLGADFFSNILQKSKFSYT